MADKFKKDSDRIARSVAHGAEALSPFERAVFWVKLLQLQAPERGIAIMKDSRDPTDVARTTLIQERGRNRAYLGAIVDLLVEGRRTPNPPSSAGKAATAIFHWHDWASFEMDLGDWVSALPKAGIVSELEKRAKGPDSELIAGLLADLG